MSDHIFFELASWKKSHKNFLLVVALPKKDPFGMHDYYTVYFICNGKIKTRYKNRRFIMLTPDYFSFTNVTEPHGVNGLLYSFHYSKIDILGLKVLECPTLAW